MRRTWRLRGTLCLLALRCTLATAQPAATTTVNDALLSIATQAGVIFAGHVLSIDREDAAGFVDIRFHIDEAVRNCPRQGSYTLREWAGLWSSSDVRYRVGQKLIMLLYNRGPSGMSSPVGGLDGAIPIIAGGRAPLARGTGKAPADQASGPADLLVDVRWIRAQTLRTTASTSGQKHVTSLTESDWSGPVTPYVLRSSKGSLPVSQQPAYLSIMTLLRGAPEQPITTPILSPDAKP